MIWVGETPEEKLGYALNYAELLLDGIAYHLGVEEKMPKLQDASGRIIPDLRKLPRREGFEIAVKKFGNKKLEDMYELYKIIKDLCESTSLSDLEEVEEKIEEMEKISDEIIEEYR